MASNFAPREFGAGGARSFGAMRRGVGRGMGMQQPMTTHGPEDALEADQLEAAARTMLANMMRDADMARRWLGCLARGNHHLFSATAVALVAGEFGEGGDELRPWAQDEERELGGYIQCWSALGAERASSDEDMCVRIPVHAPISGERFVVTLRAREGVSVVPNPRSAMQPLVSPRPMDDEQWARARERVRYEMLENWSQYVLQVRYGRPEAAGRLLAKARVRYGAEDEEWVAYAERIRYEAARSIAIIERAMPELLDPAEETPSEDNEEERREVADLRDREEHARMQRDRAKGKGKGEPAAGGKEEEGEEDGFTTYDMTRAADVIASVMGRRVPGENVKYLW